MTFMPLQLPPGIVRGANPDDAPGRWYDGSLIRWREGIMEPVGGWSRLTASPMGSTVRRLMQWKRNNNLTMTMVGCDSHLYADNSGAYVNVAPSDLVPLTSAGTGAGYGAGTYGSSTYGTPRTGATALTSVRAMWSFDNWGEDLLAVASTDGRLLYYTSNTPSALAVPVGVYSISTISRTSNVSTIVTSTAHNLTTGDLVKVAGVTDATYNIASVSVTVTNSTTFTYANTGTNGSSSGGTVTDLSVPTSNRGVVVTPERFVVLLQCGGNSRRVGWCSREDYTDWNFASTTNTAGFIDLQSETPLVNGCSVREGTLIWSVNRAFLLRYIGLPYVFGADELGSTKIYSPNAFAEFDGRCAWMEASGFKVYESGSVKPLPCPLTDYIFSNIDPLYGPRVAHAAMNGKFNEIWWFYPSLGQTECDRYVVWNWSEDWWSMGSLPRTAAFPAVVSGYPIMAGQDKHLYQHEDGWAYTGSDIPSSIYVQSGTLNMPDNESNLSISQVVPSNGGNYALTSYSFYSRLTPNGAERTFGPYNSRTDGYVDCRVTGRDVRIKVAARAGGDWSVGRLRLKVGSAGGRR
jgi:hypothetical protein